MVGISIELAESKLRCSEYDKCAALLNGQFLEGIMELTPKQAYIIEALEEIDKVPFKFKGPFKKKWADRLGISVATLDKYRRQLWGNKRIRSDKGKRLIENLDAYVVEVFNRKLKQYADSNEIISTKKAIEICETEKLIPVGVVNSSTANKVARQLGIDTNRQLRIKKKKSSTSERYCVKIRLTSKLKEKLSKKADEWNTDLSQTITTILNQWIENEK